VTVFPPVSIIPKPHEKRLMANPNPKRAKSGADGKIRYAVIGLGYISQVALLPAFAHAKKNSELVALVSGDPEKLKQLSRQYGVQRTYSYEQYEDCLNGGEVDAVYIGLPNHMHRDYTVRAARAGVHILCEKPMAVTEQDCEVMIAEAREKEVKLMIAYRLHFEEANLKAIELVQSGKLGEVRLFNSTFTGRPAAARSTTTASIASTRPAISSGRNRVKFSPSRPTTARSVSARSRRWPVPCCAFRAIGWRRSHAVSAPPRSLPIASSARRAICGWIPLTISSAI